MNPPKDDRVLWRCTHRLKGEAACYASVTQAFHPHTGGSTFRSNTSKHKHGGLDMMEVISTQVIAVVSVTSLI